MHEPDVTRPVPPCAAEAPAPERDTRIALHAAVRTVVEFSVCGEDLQVGGSQRMVEGGQAHRARQAQAVEADSGYRTEVPLSITVEGAGVRLEVSGRADGLFWREGLLVVEEIKLAARDAEHHDARPEHWAQAACYGHILCVEDALAALTLRVLYVDVDGAQIACFEQTHTAPALAALFDGLVTPYLAYIEERVAWHARRDASLARLPFPYDAYRAGQRAFAANVYVAVRDRKRLLGQAPTGIGKTAAALFPALKALGEGLTGQVYYLTARTTGKAIAMAGLARMRAQGAMLRTLELTAKEKCCPREGGMHCDPAVCPYIKGYFLRIGDALEALLAQPCWDAETVYAAATAHTVCPFECSLALCERADVVVCDYNYAFDPGARLQRIFLHRRDLTLLIDEAHHLVDRARDMLSAQLDSGDLRALRRTWRAAHGQKSDFYRAVTAVLHALEALRKGMTEQEHALAEPPDLRALVQAFAEEASAALDRHLLPGRALLDAFLDAQNFLACLGRYDDTYATLLRRQGKELAVRLLCLDPAPYLQKCTAKLRGVVAFSATLSPLRGYAQLLGFEESDGLLALPSPFPPDNLCVMVRGVSTRWAHRADTLPQVVDAVAAMVQARTGNYLCMFPSYAYLRSAQELLARQHPALRLLVQQGDMDEAARADFLAQFVPGGEGLLGLAVMGGAFGEGIDLPGERLSGVAVVGIGLPQVCVERETLRDYYQRALGDGFAYAYRYPGITRVLQAVGRVIRTEQDVGVALLIDDRFQHAQVSALLPTHWLPPRVAYRTEQIEESLRAFWQRKQGAGRRVRS